MVPAKVSVAVLLGLSLGVLLAELKPDESVMSVLAFPGNLGSIYCMILYIMYTHIYICVCVNVPVIFSTMYFLHSSIPQLSSLLIHVHTQFFWPVSEQMNTPTPPGNSG